MSIPCHCGPAHLKCLREGKASPSQQDGLTQLAGTLWCPDSAGDGLFPRDVTAFFWNAGCSGCHTIHAQCSFF